MRPRPPLGKVELIERSMRCFVSGLIGLVPVLGIPFAAVAIWNNVVLRSNRDENWNPAGRYVVWGAVCGVVGLLWSTALLFLFGLAAINAMADH